MNTFTIKVGLEMWKAKIKEEEESVEEVMWLREGKSEKGKDSRFIFFNYILRHETEGVVGKN